MGAISRIFSRRVSKARGALGLCVLGIVLGVLYLVQTHKIEFFEITSASMDPALKVGDRLIMTKNMHLYRGDIVVFLKPEQDRAALVKRVVALAPDRVEVRHGQLYVNGVRNDPPQGQTDDGPQPDRAWDLQPGEGFVAGDNRPLSIDSRDYGPIGIDTIQGIVMYRVAPKERRGMIRN